MNTIIGVQPRIRATGGGKTSDEMVFELADNILEKLPDELSLENAKPEYFVTDSKGRVDSLTTVMTQEVDRFNKLLKIVKVSRPFPLLFSSHVNRCFRFVGVVITSPNKWPNVD